MKRLFRKLIKRIAYNIDLKLTDEAMRYFAGRLFNNVKAVKLIRYQNDGLCITVRVCMPISDRIERMERKKVYPIEDEVVEKFPELTFDFWVTISNDSDHEWPEWKVIRRPDND